VLPLLKENKHYPSFTSDLLLMSIVLNEF